MCLGLLAIWMEGEPELYQGKEDKELVHLYQAQQDPIIIAVLIERYAPQIAAICWSFFKDQEQMADVSQQLFITLSEKLMKMEVHKNFRSWLCTLVKNQLIDFTRRRQLHHTYINQAIEKPTFEKIQLDFDQKTLVKEALNLLNERQRTCVELHYFQHLSYREVAKEMNLSFDQVRGVMGRSINKLRKHLGKRFQAIFEES